MKVLFQFAALVVAKVPYVFGNLTLGFTPSRKASSRWYNTNDTYRFPIGSKIFVHRKAFGYGIRAEGVVVGYKNHHVGVTGEVGNRYVVEVTSDSVGNWHRWWSEDYVDPNAKRVTKTQIHFKWNLENQWAYSIPWHLRLKEWVEKKLGIVSDRDYNPTLYRLAS